MSANVGRLPADTPVKDSVKEQAEPEKPKLNDKEKEKRAKAARERAVRWIAADAAQVTQSSSPQSANQAIQDRAKTRAEQIFRLGNIELPSPTLTELPAYNPEQAIARRQMAHNEACRRVAHESLRKALTHDLPIDQQECDELREQLALLHEESETGKKAHEFSLATFDAYNRALSSFAKYLPRKEAEPAIEKAWQLSECQMTEVRELYQIDFENLMLRGPILHSFGFPIELIIDMGETSKENCEILQNHAKDLEKWGFTKEEMTEIAAKESEKRFRLMLNRGRDLHAAGLDHITIRVAPNLSQAEFEKLKNPTTVERLKKHTETLRKWGFEPSEMVSIALIEDEANFNRALTRGEELHAAGFNAATILRVKAADMDEERFELFKDELRALRKWGFDPDMIKFATDDEFYFNRIRTFGPDLYAAGLSAHVISHSRSMSNAAFKRVKTHAKDLQTWGMDEAEMEYFCKWQDDAIFDRLLTRAPILHLNNFTINLIKEAAKLDDSEFQRLKDNIPSLASWGFTQQQMLEAARLGKSRFKSLLKRCPRRPRSSAHSQTD